MAQRLEALSPKELLALGANVGRDYGEPINLEEFWRSSPKQFERVVFDIADRRAAIAEDVDIRSFGAHLQDSLDGSEWQAKFDTALNTVSMRVKDRHSRSKRYQEWLEKAEREEGTIRQRAIAWRALEILIQRYSANAQQLLSIDVPLQPEDLAGKDAYPVRSAAERYLGEEFEIPYYFGPARLGALASSNIDQFLELAGDLFEEMVSAAILRLSSALSPERQDAILTRAARLKWNDIPRKVANGREVQKLLASIASLAIWEWKKGTASYGGGGGVTGIGMKMTDRERLVAPKTKSEEKRFGPLALVLSSCASSNLLEVALGRSQGEVGQTWMIMYLNRWLCLYFGLPLQYGGWRPVSPEELCVWLDEGFKPQKRGKRRSE